MMDLKRTFRLKMVILLYSLILFGEVAYADQEPTKQRTVVGRVSDGNKAPIAGVVVETRDKTRRTVTNQNGQYSIEVSVQEEYLLFSRAGYASQEVKLGTNSVLNIVMKEKKSVLNEAANLGYYAVKKRAANVSAGYINTNELSDVPVIRFEEALAGRVAGLRVSSPHGQPGDPLSLVVHGENTLHEASPLFVVDGIPVENLNALILNTNDIKSMTVLKDASLLALYGSRGANGVILLETKDGYAGKSTIQFNSLLGFQEANRKIEMMSPYDFVRYQLELNASETKAMYTPADLQPGDPDYDPSGRTLSHYRDIRSVDWQDRTLRTAPIQRYSLSMAGGDANTKFVASTSFNDQVGVLLNSGARAYQGRAKLSQRVGRYINSGFGINYGQRPRYGQALNFEEATSLSTYALYRMWGARPVSGSNNDDIVTPWLDPDYNTVPNIKYNPVTTLENEDKRHTQSNLLGNAYVEVDILRNLKARAQGSIVSDKERATTFYNTKTPSGSGANGVNGSSYYSKTISTTADLTLSYSGAFGNVHTLDVLGGFSTNSVRSESYGFEVNQLPNEDIGIYGFDEGLPVYTLSKSWEDRFSSYFARGQYGFKHKYFLTGVFRADEGFDKTLGYSPAVGLAWDMKGEHFLRSSKVVSHAKLRASYGRSGARPKNPLTSLFMANLTAPDMLMWEAVDQLGIGYDLGLWEDRVILNLDYYDRVSSTDSRYFSMARIENKGIEVAVTTLNIDRPSFKWRSNLNVSFNQNKVLTMRDRQAITSAVFFSNAPLYLTTSGEQLGTFYGYQFDGVYQVEDFDDVGGVYVLKPDVSSNGAFRGSIQPGDIKYKDTNGDGYVDVEDQVVLGNSLPKHFGGFNNSFTYKAFDLNIFFQWSYGNKIFNANRMAFEGNYLQGVGVNQYASYNDRWTPENRSNTLFRVGGQGPADMLSDRTLEDGSYVRLKTVSLGYALPTKWMKTKNLKALRLFASAQNLFTLTNYSGLDPEVSIQHSALIQGFDYGAYPQYRTIAFGLNATF